MGGEGGGEEGRHSARKGRACTMFDWGGAMRKGRRGRGWGVRGGRVDWVRERVRKRGGGRRSRSNLFP